MIIVGIYERIKDVRVEKGLSPCEEVNKLFGKLVGICTENFEKDVVKKVS